MLRQKYTKKPREKKWRLSRSLFMLLLPALLTAGCTITTVVDVSTQKYTLSGTAKFGPYGLPLDGAQVTISGPIDKTVQSDYQGNFQATGLVKGSYEISVSTPFGNQFKSVYVNQNTVASVNVPYPAWFDTEYFYYISGLWDYSVGTSGQLESQTGFGTWRWPNNVNVPVYLDTSGAQSSVPSSVADYAWDYMKTWEQTADSRFTTTRVTTTNPYGIEILWVPANSLEPTQGTGTVGSTMVVTWDPRGYVQKIQILVDARYADVYSSDVITRNVLRHEIWHAIGASHVKEQFSLLYPFVGQDQSSVLSQKEKDYISYSYWIGPYLSLPYQRNAGIMGTQSVRKAQVPSGTKTYISRPGKGTEVVDGVPDYLMKNKRVKELFGNQSNKTGGTDLLWDTIGK